LRENLKQQKAGATPEVQPDKFRCLIEELRAPLFAKELKTPLSAKRLQRIWQAMQR